MQTTPLLLDGHSLSVADVMRVSEARQSVALAPEALPRIQAARDVVEQVILDKKVVYGINTGFGYLKNKVIPTEDLETLQRNLILSHACGVGEPFSETVVRGIMLLRANTLCQGYSGARVELIQLILDCLNQGLHPVIPSQGSVGASGDLAPLSHLALSLMGEGDVNYQGQRMATADAMKQAGLEPVVLQAKEGLALINGTQPMTSLGCIVLDGFEHLLNVADLIAALSIQVGLGSREAFRPELHALRPHLGQVRSAALLWHWMQDSPLIDSHENCLEVQDAYSFRCVPQVHGASRNSASHAAEVLSCEINAVTDNPIILPDTQEIVSCGHFHGQPIALVMDYLGIALAEIANISERRIERLVNPKLNRDLPAFLSPFEGLNSGYMIPQYVAAALVSENKVLAHPASVDSIPTSANQEDHVSMGTIGANKALKILKHVQQVLAIEMLCAVQALDLRRPLACSPATEALYEIVRAQIPMLQHDRYAAPDLEQARDILVSTEMRALIAKLLPVI